jgi:hypothetical protein
MQVKSYQSDGLERLATAKYPSECLPKAATQLTKPPWKKPIAF